MLLTRTTTRTPARILTPSPTRILSRRLFSGIRRYLGLHLLQVYARGCGVAAQAPGRCLDLECRVLPEWEALALCENPELELTAESVRSAHARGDFCVGALDGGRLVAYVWLSYTSAPHTGGVWVGYAAAGRYSYKSFVLPEYRGRRIVQSLYVAADELRLRRGRNYVVYMVDTDNVASQAAARRSGSRLVGYAGFLSLAGLFIGFSSKGAKSYGVRFFKLQSQRLTKSAARRALSRP
jgi:ribosomal protein S18 acetylase RimI-like enzyme